MKQVAGRLRLDLAQFRELEAFSAFGSDLDKASKAQLERGSRLVELLKQAQYTPYSVERQVVSMWAGTSGELDDVPVQDIRRFERDFLDYVAHSHKGVYETILNSGQLSDDTIESLKSALADFKKQFETSTGDALGQVDHPAKAMEGDEEQEKVSARKRSHGRDDDGDAGAEDASGSDDNDRKPE
jgi:F-type H+/Na+-transporting ATPase subunit alpha